MEYEKINDLKDISKKAIEKIGDEPYIINFDLKVSFEKELIPKSIPDMKSLADDFQNPICPETLYINHGMFIHKNDNGIKNVIKELNKDKSNRAIISLINQEDIINSGDEPIPSFMILQFTIENKILYVTAYFRALEVANFLRINVEEIRQIIEKIKEEHIHIEKVMLNIIAFRAYNKPDRNPLIKPKIDLCNKQGIFKYMLLNADINELVKLLDEKAAIPTKIEYQSFLDIISWLEDKTFQEMIHPNLKKQLVPILLKELVQILIELKKLREKSSYHMLIDNKESEYKKKIDNLIMEIRNES